MVVEEESNKAQHPPWLETTGQLSAAARRISNHFYLATRDGISVGVIWVEIVGVGPQESRWPLRPRDRSETEFEWQIEATEFVRRDGDMYEDIGTYEIPLNTSRFSCLAQGQLELSIGEALLLVPMTDEEEVAFNKSILR